MAKRKTEIDFLRGIAVLLVLLRHQQLISFTNRIGWIGVDLFFVLSGFLVSGLLFREYIKYGKIKFSRFFLRRGFKIYPAFYFLILITIFCRYLFKETFSINQLLGEVFFLQNYWDNLWGHTWSLAVEEHFYILLIPAAVLIIKYKQYLKTKISWIFIFLLMFILSIRFYTNIHYPYKANFFATHLRIDSLLAGVFIAYLYYYKRAALEVFYNKYNWKLLVASFLLLLPPLVQEATMSFFVKTAGFSILYISFSLLLIHFILNKNILQQLYSIFTKPLVNAVAKIGMYSYSIYLFHLFVRDYILGKINMPFITSSVSISFMFYFFVSILLGIIISRLIEIPFLKLREKLLPTT